MEGDVQTKGNTMKTITTRPNFHNTLPAPTQRGQLTKNPRINAIVERAREIEHQWKAAERERLRTQAIELDARRKALGEAA
jgi:hypothetical protein